MLNIKKNPYIDLIIAGTILFIVIRLIDNYTSVLSSINSFIAIFHPFIFAFIIAYILNPLLSFFEEKLKFKRALSISLTYVLIIGLITIFITSLLPKIADNVVELFNNSPKFANQAKIWINNNIEFLNRVDSKRFFINNLKSGILNFKDMFLQSMNIVFIKTLSFTSFFAKIIFGFIISIYVLYDKEKFIKNAKKIIYIILKKKNGDNFLNLLKNIHYMLSTYIGIKAIDSFIIAVICFIGISILKSPYTLLIAVIVGFTNMIPYFGPFIGMIVGFIINIFFNPMIAVKILIFLFFLQQFDAWYLDPKLIGSKVGLSPFLVIFAVTIGGSLFGIIGMLLGVPTMAVLKIYIDNFFQNHTKIKS
ncbi:AI-2E family transporter [Clostridium aestuarii]|uniref:AI-2E family transporter n=1 Tax=Clostridium aestuarii TaxID=338193 RepID=A0ABT4D0W9_9CLOT|nr:AI-2E family transporter [Clostridium aestuarii]MCY6484890.1 AI-2E family transporter [Clostridium aestuarii]